MTSTTTPAPDDTRTQPQTEEPRMSEPTAPSPADHDVDVLVVGAGPVGLSTAVTLARWDVDLMVVDADTGPTTQSRAVWIHPRTVELLDGMGIAAAARAEGVLMDRIDVHHGARSGGSIHYDGRGRTHFPEGLILEQSRTQRLLLARAAGLGVTPSWDRRLTALQQDQDGVRAQVEDADGQVRTVRARWVVGADGATSAVRDQVGLELVGDSYDDSFFTGDLVMRVPLHRERAHLSVTRSRTFALLPLPGTDRWRVVATVPPATEESLGRDAGPTGGPALSRTQVHSLLADLRVPHEIEAVDWATLYRSHHRVVDTFRAGRVLLAGDAAHIHSPAGGLGMNTGIGDAVDLGWRLGLAVAQPGGADTLLDGYADERRGVALDVLRTSDRVFTLQAGSGRLLGLLRSLLMPRVPAVINLTERGRRLAFDTLSQLGISYAAGRGRGQGLRAGDRLPLAVQEPDQSSHDQVDPGRFVLLGAGADDDALDALVAVVDGHGLPVVRQPMSPSVAPALGVRAGDVVLVRPDGHVAWRGRCDDGEGLAAALRAVGVAALVPV